MTRLADIAPESILLAGAGRAILLQIAHPAVGHGVARHSDFARRPMSRLNGTLTYIYALAAGDERDIRAVQRAVNRAHAPVSNPPRGERAPSRAPGGAARDSDHAVNPHGGTGAGAGVGPRYDARDPELQVWVAATLYDTALLVYERVFGALDDDTAERVYREYAVLGTALQMPPELWPADRAAFRRYFDGMLAGLAVDDTVRGVAAALLRAERAPLPVRAAMPLARQATIALLPPGLRAPFGLAWSESRQLRFDRAFAVTAAVYRHLPGPLRRLPQRHYLRTLHRRTA